jgi:Flp pilus assembly protein TadD
MPYRRAPAILSAFVFLLFSLRGLDAAPGQSISGRVMFEDGGFTCDRQCTVTLLISGVRPLQTVMADLSGHFTFNNVTRGPYTIRVEIDGVEAVNSPISDLDIGHDVIVNVPRIRTAPAQSTGSPIVDVSEFLNRYPKKAVSYFEKGSASMKNKKTDDAVKYFRNAVELAPTFYEAHNQLGLAYMETGHKDDAEREFLLAHELNSNAVDPLLSLTRIYLDANDFERALSTSEQAVKANPRSAQAFFNLGFALYKTDQLDRSETALKRALDLGPKVGVIRLMLANVYMKSQRFESAVEQLNKYIFENPKGQQLQEAKDMRDRLLQASAENRP